MDSERVKHPVSRYPSSVTGYHYGRSLAGYETRYGLVPMTDEDTRAHAESMADARTDTELAEFIQGFMRGYDKGNR